MSENGKQARKKLYEFTVAGNEKDWDPFKQALGGYLLGQDSFIRRVKSERVPLKKDGTVSRLREVQKPIDVEEIRGRISRITKDERLRDKLLAYHLKKNTPLRLKEIGALLGGKGFHAVSKLVSRFEAEAGERKDYREAMSSLEKRMDV